MIKWKRNAVLYLASQFISMFGSMLVQYAIGWQITLETQSGLILMLFSCAALLPMTLISPLAGVWADRYPRKQLIVLSDGLIALVTLLLALAHLLGYKELWLLFAVVVVRSLGQGVQQPAVSAMIPQMVPWESLQRFNGIQSALHSLNMFGAPMVAGVLLSYLPMERILFIDVVTALIGISIVLVFVRVEGVSKKEERKTGVTAYLHELQEGLQYIRSKTWLKVLIIYSAFFSFFASPSALLTPLQAVRTFGEEVWRLTAIEIVFSLGAVAGGIVVSAGGGFKNKAHTMVAACVLFGLSSLLLGVVSGFEIYLVMMLLCGLSMPLFSTPTMTLMQSHIDQDKLGRVFSVMMMASGSAMPLGMVIFGPLADAVKIEGLLIASGVVIFISGFALLRVRALMEIGKA